MENIKTLKDFKTSIRTSRIFNEASGQIPEFFNQNLVDQARTIKIFVNDQAAYIKIFYFQFLKLCFETEDIDYDTKINKFIDTIQKNVNLLTLSPSYSVHKKPSEQNIKNLLFQFLQVISQCKQPVEKTLSQYPIIGDIITNFLCSYLKKYHKIPKSDYNTIQTIKILSQLFMCQIMDYDSCIQFSDSQVYVYKQNSQRIFMIYIDQSKVQRNACLNTGSEFISSNKSLQKSNYQVITFDGTDVIFDETASGMTGMTGMSSLGKHAKGTLSTQYCDTKQYFETLNNNNSHKSHDQKQNIYIQQQMQLSCSKKQKPKNQLQKLLKDTRNSGMGKQYINITKQFTNTYILDNIIIQPYRGKIKEIKTKARADRKSKQAFFM